MSKRYSFKGTVVKTRDGVATLRDKVGTEIDVPVADLVHYRSEEVGTYEIEIDLSRVRFKKVSIRLASVVMLVALTSVLAIMILFKNSCC
jgi:hypothetical protein